MPLPTPQKDEKESEFVPRCIPLVIEDQGLDAGDEDQRAQAVAICYSQYRKAQEGESSMGKQPKDSISFEQWVKEKLGLEDQVTAVRQAFYARFEPRPGMMEPVAIEGDVWILAPIEEDHIIAQIGGPDDVYRIDYEIDDEGNVVFGEPRKGEWVFNPAEAAGGRNKKARKPQAAQRGAKKRTRISEVAKIFESEDKEGKVWRVTIIQEGLSKNGNYYPPEALKAAVSVFEGVQVFDNHLDDEEWADRRGHRNVNREYMGWIDNVFYADEALHGDFHVADIILREKMRTVWEGGRKDEFGFSIDAGVVAEEREMDGQQVRYVLEFLERDSVDVVFDPSAGGRMEHMLEQYHRMLENYRGGNTMTVEELMQVLKGLSADERTSLLREFTKSMSEEARAAFLKEFAPAGSDTPPVPASGDTPPVPASGDTPPVPASGDTPPVSASEDTPPASAGDTPPASASGNTPLASAGDAPPANDMLAYMLAEAERKMEAIDLKMYQADLKAALADSKLPRKARTFLWEQFSGRIFEMKDVNRAIEAQRDILATETPSGQVQGMGGIRLSAGQVVKPNAFQYALERMMGVLDPEDEDKAEKHIVGLREWYTAFTGDYEWKGYPTRQRVTEANVTSTTVTSIVSNVLNKRLLMVYNAAVNRRWWDPIVTPYPEDTINDVTVFQVYGIGALPTVEEGATYTEATWGDFEETASFAKKGKVLAVPMEVFMKDRANALRAIPDVLHNAWFYAVQSAVSALFTANSGEGATLGTTSRNWFNSTEGNLGSGSAYALSYATFDAGQVALATMTEAGSSEPMGLYGKYLLVSPTLRGTARQIRDSEKDPDGFSNAANTWREEFEVIPVPKWTSNTSRWYLLPDKGEAPMIGFHTFQGKGVPELFIADGEMMGAVFTNDVIRYKIRDWFAVSLAGHFGYGGVPS